MADSAGNGCPNCNRLEKRLAELEARLALAESELAAARKNSGNSSKPPSSDLVKPPLKSSKKGRRRKRKQGAQPGHPRHERPEFSPEEVNVTSDYRLDCCPDCQGHLKDAALPPKRLQQVDLDPRPIIIGQADRKGQRQPAGPV